MVQYQSDGTPFKPGQLFDPLTFNAQQAAMLNNVPGQSLSATNSTATIQAAQNLSPNIPARYVQPATPLGITNPPAGADTAGGMVAGAAAGVQSYNDYLAMLTPAETDTSKTSDAITSQINTLLGQDIGRGAAQLSAEKSVGLPGLNRQVADINAQILSRTAQYNKLSVGLEGKPITMNSIIGGQAQIRKAEAADIGLLQAVALGLQGQVAAAQGAADRAVDLKYDDIEQQIDIRLKQLDLLQPKLDAEEKRRSQALELYLNDQKDRAAEEKDSEKQFQNYKLDAIAAGLTVEAAQKAEQLYNQGRVDEAYATVAASTPKKVSSNSNSGGFTTTQVNKGASTAGVPIAEFKSYDADTQNFFINSAGKITDWKKYADEQKDLDTDPRELESAIDGYDMPDAVKETLRRYLREKFADEYTAADNQESSTTDTGGEETSKPNTPWWKKFSLFGASNY